MVWACFWSCSRARAPVAGGLHCVDGVPDHCDLAEADGEPDGELSECDPQSSFTNGQDGNFVFGHRVRCYFHTRLTSSWASAPVMSQDLEQPPGHREHYDAEEPHDPFHDAELSGEAGDLL